VKTFIISIAVLLAGLWLFCLVSLASGQSRSMRRIEERLSLPHAGIWSTGGWKLLLSGSVLKMINVIGVLLGSIWYGVRGKPFPPPPPPRR
jgi:hypothetical protein